MIDIKVINDRQLLNLFNDLQKVHQTRIVREGLRNAAKPILQQAKINFNLRKKNKSKTDYENLNSYFKIELNRNKDGAKIGVVNYYKARWIEWGTVDRFYTTKKNKVEHKTGKIVATHFFFDAVNSKKDEAQRSVSKYITQALENTIKKYDN